MHYNCLPFPSPESVIYLSNRQETKEKKKTEENALVEKKKLTQPFHNKHGENQEKKPVEVEHKKQGKIKTITNKTLKGGKKICN
jgi:hypothetical protein